MFRAVYIPGLMRAVYIHKTGISMPAYMPKTGFL